MPTSSWPASSSATPRALSPLRLMTSGLTWFWAKKPSSEPIHANGFDELPSGNPNATEIWQKLERSVGWGTTASVGTGVADGASVAAGASGEVDGLCAAVTPPSAAMEDAANSPARDTE